MNTEKTEQLLVAAYDGQSLLPSKIIKWLNCFQRGGCYLIVKIHGKEVFAEDHTVMTTGR